MSSYRVANTVVSGSSVLSSLQSNDFRAIEFSAAMANPASVQLVAGASVNKELTLEQINQASIASLGINMATGGSISLGPDTASQAASYINLFNFSSTDQQRLLRFHLTNADPTAINKVDLKNANSAGAGSFISVVSLTGPAAAPTGVAVFFGTGPTQFPSGNAAGIERLVSVVPKNLSAGSQAVQFNILPYSM
jgi:hypothetical protein